MKRFNATIICLAVVASSAAGAKEHSHSAQPASTNAYQGLYQAPSQALSRSGSDSADFDHSGTRGREELGASPFNPEGPGNLQD
jgi:hypothetical protein